MSFTNVLLSSFCLKFFIFPSFMSHDFLFRKNFYFLTFQFKLYKTKKKKKIIIFFLKNFSKKIFSVFFVSRIDFQEEQWNPFKLSPEDSFCLLNRSEFFPFWIATFENPFWRRSISLWIDGFFLPKNNFWRDLLTFSKEKNICREKWHFQNFEIKKKIKEPQKR